jgi:uncharacterized protein (TIGR03435 family)
MTRSGRYEMRNATMVDLVAKAYGVDQENVFGGPTWLELDRFDVLAKLPDKSLESATPEANQAMLQALLAERFKLAAHKETKPMPAFSLVAGKRPSLKKSEGSGEGGCKFTFPPPPPPSQPGGPPPAPPVITYTCTNTTMAAFAKGMKDMINTTERPAVDNTGLEGAFDFTLKYSLGRGMIMIGAASPGDTVTFVDALEKQLGLKLESVKVPMPVIVVDSVERKPTANVPNVAELLGTTAAPTEFEVADIKPTDPSFMGMRFQIQNGGRVNLRGVTVKFMIQQAWNITDEQLVGAPKWLGTDRYDIVAKAASGGPTLDIDTVWIMLRGLLAERFKLATHNEEKLVAAYTLVAGKPKLKKADPTSRTRFKEGPADDTKDPRDKNPALGRLITCQNVTMAQFAERLQSLAGGYIHSPVLDATGIEGGWDFSLNFSPAGLINGGGRGGRGGDGPPSGDGLTASDPSGGISLFEAVEKQLGLKLESQKRMASVLVIDHIEQKPTEN